MLMICNKYLLLFCFKDKQKLFTLKIFTLVKKHGSVLEFVRIKNTRAPF